jgi:hypothetical protein
MTLQYKLDFVFPRTYEVTLLGAAPPVHPLEKLYHYPVELEEGDRSGLYLRISPRDGPSWRGFFALGFDSDQVVNVVSSCPDEGSLCAIAGGYAYVVKAAEPAQWFRVEQHPVRDLRALVDMGLLLFVGFTSITALDANGIRWTTARLSWEGLSDLAIQENKLRGRGWDAMTDQEVPFEVDLASGQHTGGARPVLATDPGSRTSVR